MAYNVSQEFTDKLYSGESNFRAILTIGGVEIPNDQIASISISSPIINDTNDAFYIGTFISQKLTIKFKNMEYINVESGQEVSLEIGQYIDGEYIYVPIGLYLVDELEENYYKTCEINCLDYAIKFKPNIDYAPCFVDGKATIKTILEYICNYFGVELGDYPSINDNIEIGTYDNTVSGKQWISYIAELKGCNAKMDREGRLTLQPLKQPSNIPINALKSKSFDIGEKYRISKVTYFDAIRNFTFGDDTENTLYIRQDNPFIVDETVVENIYNEVEGFEIYNIKCENYGDFTLDAWDLIEYSLGEETYTTWNNNTLTYAMTIMGKVETKIPTKQQEVTTNVIESNIRTVKTTVDNVNNKVNIEVSEIHDTLDEQDEKIGSLEISNDHIVSVVSDMEDTVAEQNNKISQVSQRADELDLKISDIADVTVSGESTIGRVNLEGANESSPAYIKVHPINNDIARVYPYKKLYPNANLYPKPKNVIKFTNTTTEEVFYYELPQNLYWYNQNIYDEFVLSYNDRSCQVVKRVTYDSNGNKVVLQEPEYITLPYVEEPDLTAGDYQVELLNYTSAYLKVRLIASNYYTTQFATKAELRLTANDITSTVSATYETKENAQTNYSQINQTTNSISQTVSNNNTKANIVAKINDNTSSVKIDADKIDLKANNVLNILSGNTINLTSKNIAIDSTNFKVDKNGNVTANNLTATNANLSGRITATSGTIGGCTISGGKLQVANANISSINGSKVTDFLGSYISGGEISKGSLSYNRYVDGKGWCFLRAGYDFASHPYVSALNVAYGAGGISFRNTNTNSSTGSEIGYIKTVEAKGNLRMYGNNGVSIQAGGTTYIDGTSVNINEVVFKDHYVHAGNLALGGNYLNADSGRLNLNSGSGVYANGTRIGGASDRKAKKNIKDLSDEIKEKLYNEVKELPAYSYDYKEQYGDKDNIGFIIQDFENNEILGKVLHITEFRDIKSYNHEDLSQVNTILIKMLMEKIDNLEKEIDELKKENK